MSLDDSQHAAAVVELLALAADAAAGVPIAVVGADGTVIAGTPPPEPPAVAHPIVLEGGPAGRVIAGEGAPASLVMLLARSLELAVGGAHRAAAQARMAEELAIGRRIQAALIPRRFPEVPGWSFAAAYEAATEVGGDLYDAFLLRGRTDRFALLVADVTGKGIPAALLMADVRALLHAAADNAEGPADALGRVNRILVRERATSLFVTAALLVVDPASGMVRYASAGHEPPIAVRLDGGQLVELDAKGPLLGAFDAAVFEERTDRLEPGDALVLYTDGITESRDAAREFFGEARLTIALAAAPGEGAAAIADRVMEAVRGFRGGAPPFDDLTLLVATRDRGEAPRS
jgi:phosphoserine phosphatase RsbU/P